MGLGAELLLDLVEAINERFHAFELVLREGGELLNGREHVNKLNDAAAEEVELAKDLVRLEVELLPLRHLPELALGDPVLFLVSFVELKARLELADELLWILLPERVLVIV